VRERELGRRRKLPGLEPAQLDQVVARTRRPGRARGPGEAEHDAALVRLEPVTEEGERLDLERRLLADLSPQRVERVLVLVQETPRQVPTTGGGIMGAAPEQHAPVLVEADRFGARDGVGVGDVPASTALGAVLDLLDSLAADGTEAPPVESSHARDHMSPRAAGATQHELSRIGLLATLPGETLARLAQRMTREEISAGAGVFSEGDDGDRFYVVLSGMLAVSQQSIGPQAILRPGDYFGEVALAMRMPRTASVRALTPATVASCDKATFDEFVRPLFADDD
jgi:Cyclic nucleotide-binding domain